MIDKINLYISSKDMLCDDIFVYPQTGVIQKETGEYNQAYNEYIRDNKVYIVIDGIMYNKARLIYDSYYKDELPKKRYKVFVNDTNIGKMKTNLGGKLVLSVELGNADTSFIKIIKL